MLSIYQSVEVVSKDAHAQTKIKPRPDYLFSRDSRECVVTVDEFFDCAKSMPILLARMPMTSITPLVCLGCQVKFVCE